MHVRAVPANMRVRFESVALTILELLAFNDQCTLTCRQTHIKRKHYLSHSLRSLGGDDNCP